MIVLINQCVCIIHVLYKIVFIYIALILVVVVITKQTRLDTVFISLFSEKTCLSYFKLVFSNYFLSRGTFNTS